MKINKKVIKKLQSAQKLNRNGLTLEQLEWRIANMPNPLFGFHVKHGMFTIEKVFLLQRTDGVYEIFTSIDKKIKYPTHLFGITDIEEFLDVVPVGLMNLETDEDEAVESFYEALEKLKDSQLYGYVDVENHSKNIFVYDLFD